MIKKEKEDSDIFTGFGLGGLAIDTTSTVNVCDPTFTWAGGGGGAIDPSNNIYTSTNVNPGDAWITISDVGVFEFDDPYSELEELKLEKEKEEEMRKEYPSLQDAYDNYQLVKKLVEETEFDKTFEKRYEGFSKK